MERILLLSAAEPSRSAVRAALEGTDFEVIQAPLTADVVDLAAAGSELILFDTAEGVPVVPMLRRILRHRDLSRVPVIALVDASRLPLLFRVPAIADFVVKPFASEELRTRITRILTRERGAETDGTLRIDALQVSPDSHEVRVDNTPIHFTYQEFELLRFLASNRGRVFSREQLLNDVWGYGYFGSSRTVDIHIRRIRAKLGPGCANLIATVRGIGYKFVDTPSERVEVE